MSFTKSQDFPLEALRENNPLSELTLTRLPSWRMWRLLTDSGDMSVRVTCVIILECHSYPP